MALKLVRECYGGGRGERLGPTLAAEHLAAEYGVEVHHETLRRWMLSEGLWSKERRRRQHRNRRERRAHFGELVQMDGSFHAWLGKGKAVECLLDMVGDATSQTEGRFTPEETIWAVADAPRRWVERHGVPRALYADHKNVYVRKPTLAEELRGEVALTQFGAMCQRLGIKIIAAGSPQAKGRIERGHATHQDRMVKKMRLQGIGDYAEANRYLEEEYWNEHNRRFAVEPRSSADYHRPLPQGLNLDEVFSLRQERVLSQDWVVRDASRWLQVEPRQRVRPKQRVVVEEQRSGKIRLLAGDRELCWHEIPAPQPTVASKAAVQPPTHRLRKPSSGHPWRRPMVNERRSGMEMPGGSAALGNPAHNAGFAHSHAATTTAGSMQQKGTFLSS